MSIRSFIPLMISTCLIGGCVEIFAALSGGFPDGGGGPIDGGGGPPGDGSNGGTTGLRLTVSNPNPVVNEEVLLRCAPTGGTAAGLTFAFQPEDLVIDVDPTSGIGSFIPSEPDVDTAFSFTCTATDPTGAVHTSNTQVVIPTASG